MVFCFGGERGGGLRGVLQNVGNPHSECTYVKMTSPFILIAIAQRRVPSGIRAEKRVSYTTPLPS